MEHLEVNSVNYADHFRLQLLELQGSSRPFKVSNGWLNNLLCMKTDLDDVLSIYRTKLLDYSYPVYTRESTDEFTGLRADFVHMNIGYKLHLNVEPENVSNVSEYLKRKSIPHKYLSGANPLEGKIFTLYIGSRNLASEVALEISKDLDGLLCFPVSKDGIEFAPNVVGRFNTVQEDFDRYPRFGIRGISTLSDSFESDCLVKSYDFLSVKYGEYFNGESIPPKNPECEIIERKRGLVAKFVDSLVRRSP